MNATTTTRILTVSIILAVLGLLPAVASTEETTPEAPVAMKKASTCPTGESNPDGTPVLGPCPVKESPDKAPPVNTLEDVYGAGSLTSLLETGSAPAAPQAKSRPATDSSAPRAPAKAR